MVPISSSVSRILKLLKIGTRALFLNPAGAIAMGFATSAVMIAPAAADIHRLNSDEMALFHKLSINPGQQRKSFNLDPILCIVARQRGADMARRHYFSHTTPDGKGANYLIGEAGYELPTYYDLSRSGNNIESLGMSPGTPKQMVSLWLNSGAHRDHVLGELDFFRDQISIGVGVFRSSQAPHNKYYVFLSAPPNAARNPNAVTLKSPTGVTLATTRRSAVAMAIFTGAVE